MAHVSAACMRVLKGPSSPGSHFPILEGAPICSVSLESARLGVGGGEKKANPPNAVEVVIAALEEDAAWSGGGGPLVGESGGLWGEGAAGHRSSRRA